MGKNNKYFFKSYQLLKARHLNNYKGKKNQSALICFWIRPWL